MQYIIQGETVSAVVPDGKVVGRASLATELYGQPLGPGHLFIHLEVDEPHRGQGVGAALFEALRPGMDGAPALSCAVAATDEAAFRFAARRGFRFDYQMLDGELDLTSFDRAPWRGAIARAEAGGIRFTTLATAPDVLPDLYELDRQTSADVPQWAGFMPPFDEYCATLRHGDSSGVVIALGPDGRPVGFMATDDTGHTEFLCVARSHRGRGIALALKLLTIDWAQRKGLQALQTNTNAASTLILALNRKLGYTTSPGTIYLARP
ncbi:MAG TPA: GNAT family N-acetyltransferase [Symbiobacteriaceae bacterium]|nr:GNAT family N-acetyltransferase [Symbiobacteriaceae bacterium]